MQNLVKAISTIIGFLAISLGALTLFTSGSSQSEIVGILLMIFGLGTFGIILLTGILDAMKDLKKDQS